MMIPSVNSLLAEAALKSFALTVAVGVALLVSWRLSAARRHLMLVLAIVALLGLPWATGLLPRLCVPLPASWNPRTPTPNLDAPTASVHLVSFAEGATPRPADAKPDASRSLGVPKASIGKIAVAKTAAEYLPIVWLVGAAFFALRVLRSILQARSVLRDVQRPTPRALREQLTDLCVEAGLWTKPTLLVSRREDIVPLTYGFLRPRVLVPASFEAWPAERRMATLRHELGHIKRWDWLWLMLSNAACCLYWFNPLVWILCRQLRHEAELACDDLVLRQGLGPSQYATQILEVVKLMKTTKNGMKAAVQMAGESQLEARVKALLAPGRSRAGVASWSLLALASLVGAIAVPIASLKIQDPPKAEAKKNSGASATQEQRVVVVEKSGEPTVVVEVVQADKAKGDGKKAAEESKKHLAEAKKQVKKELDRVKTRIKELQKEQESKKPSDTELKAMKMAERALERALSQLDSPGAGVRILGSDTDFKLRLDLGKEFAENAEKARELLLEKLPGDAQRPFILREFRGKDLPEGLRQYLDKDGAFRFEFKGFDDKELSKQLEKLKDLRIETPFVFDQAEQALRQSLKQLEKSRQEGVISKEEYEAARKGVQMALESMESKRKERRSVLLPEARTFIWRSDGLEGKALAPRAPGIRLLPERADRSNSIIVVPKSAPSNSGKASSTIDQMIERSEKRMEEREKRLGEKAPVDV